MSATSRPGASSGDLRNLNTGETLGLVHLCAENRFHFGRLSITPGMRLNSFSKASTRQL